MGAWRQQKRWSVDTHARPDTTAHTWGSEGNFEESLLSFDHVCSGIKAVTL